MSLRITAVQEAPALNSADSLVIGVCGTSRNTGVTTFCIALSNYLCSKRKGSTAYAEVNATREIRFINRSQTLSPSGFFDLQGIHFYPELTLQRLPELKIRKYRYYVLDFGLPVPHTRQEFLRCDLRLVIGDCSPWKSSLLYPQLDFLTDNKKLQEAITLFLVNSGHYNMPEFQLRQYRFPVLELPFFPNPFQITSSTFEVFEKILSGV